MMVQSLLFWAVHNISYGFGHGLGMIAGLMVGLIALGLGWAALQRLGILK